MPTPSIQTLRADAQQVLNLDSISAVRSVVAATLANANAGTPLNPNLTTQQLWNEFYQIVTQPKSDIESIIANQLMKFLFAPPAPGGAGADKQVIFNDGGVLAGDPQFLWNKTTNLLTVTGAATITGDLTVDTSTLKVDSANDRVGIGTATPAVRFNIADSDNAANGTIRLGVGAIYSQIKMAASSTGATEFTNVGNGANGAYNFSIDGQNQYKIATSGVFSWFDGAGGTRMTLNSTGLGVGVSPNTKLAVTHSDVVGTLYPIITAQYAAGTYGGMYAVRDGAGDQRGLAWQTYKSGTGLVESLRLSSDGNLGIGVTPSAWGGAGVKVLDVGAAGSLAGSAADVGVVGNAYYNGSGWIYKTSFFSGRYAYALGTGQHQWFTAPSGTAGNAITFTQAMTLDASGRLILLASTTTPATLATNGELTFTATSNTNLRFSYRGSDGVTRVANLTLA